MKKVLLVASHGGHWVQLNRLNQAFNGCQLHYVSTEADLANEVGTAKFSFVPDANLDTKLSLIPLAANVLWLVLRYRPDVVVSTGAAPGFFALLFGKLLGAKTIWVDSIANAQQLSVSGEKVKRFADLWLTQWPELEKPEGPFFRGSVI